MLHAALYGYSKVVTILLKNGADVNVDDNQGSTALTWAERYGHTEVATILLKNGAQDKNGADVNAKSLYGITAMMYLLFLF